MKPEIGMRVKFRHPLSDFVLALFDQHAEVTVNDVSRAIGRPSSPKRGVDAYRIVAADVLSVLADDGILEVTSVPQYAPPGTRVEDRGYGYGLAKQEVKSC